MSAARPRRVVVTGVGMVSSLGDAPAELGAALCAGRSGLAPVEQFEVDGLRCREAGEVRGFDPRAYLGEGNLRPLDRTAQLVASAAELALTDSGLGREARQGREIGLVLGTMFGSVRTISEFDRRAQLAGPLYAKPMAFANTVINAAAGQTAIWHGLEGINSTVSSGIASGLQALACAADMIRSGRAEVLLAGGGDELCFESFYGFYKSARMAGSANGRGPCAIPFDRRRNGFVLGEGAALLMLEERAAAHARGATILAEIRGHGMSYDASQGREPERATRAVVRAVRAAVADAAIEAATLDAASASANGSVDGDRNEARALVEALGRPLPTTAVKSMLGECLGASGAFQTVALLQAMADGVLPGIRDLAQPEDGWPAAMTRRESRELTIRRGLVTAAGLDGNACALVVEAAS